MDDNAPAQTQGAAPTPPQVPPKLLRDPQAVRLYCDGMSQFLLGFPISRVLLHDLVERNATDPSEPEVRHVVGEIVMPTAGLIDMAKNILAAVSQNKAVLLKIESDYGAQMRASVLAIEMDPVNLFAARPNSPP